MAVAMLWQICSYSGGQKSSFLLLPRLDTELDLIPFCSDSRVRSVSFISFFDVFYSVHAQPLFKKGKVKTPSYRRLDWKAAVGLTRREGKRRTAFGCRRDGRSPVDIQRRYSDIKAEAKVACLPCQQGSRSTPSQQTRETRSDRRRRPPSASTAAGAGIDQLRCFK